MANRGLGTLTLDLIAKIGGFTGPLSKAEREANKRMTAIEKRAYAFGKSLGKTLKYSAIAAAAAITLVTKEAIDAADQMRDLSIRLGTSTETLSAWGYAAKQTGTDIETLGRGLKILAKNAADSLNPTSEQAKIFDALGIKVADASGKLRDMSQLVPEIADKFRSLEDGTTKAALAQALFGKAGLELTEFLNSGSDGLDDFTERARELGIVIDQNTANAADNFNDTLGDLKAAVGGLGLGIARDLLPSLQGTVERLVQLITQGNLASNVADVFGAAINFAAGALSAYERAVRTTTAAIEAYVAAVGGYAEFLRNIYSFGIADGSALGGLKKIGAAFKAGDAALDQIHNPKAAKVFGVNRDVGTDTPGTGIFANVNQRGGSGLEAALAKALSNPTAKSGGKSARAAQLSDEEKEAKRLLETYQQMNASFDERIGLFGKEGEAAQIRYDIEHGELAKLAPELQATLLAKADQLDQMNEELDLQRKLDEESKRQQENIDSVLTSIREQTELVGMSADQQEVWNNLKWAGVEADSAWGQQIVASTEALQQQADAMADQISAMDTLRGAGADFLRDIKEGKNVWDSLGSAIDKVADKLFDLAAENLMDQIFGKSGDPAGGSTGGFFSALLGAFFGGGKASGGTASPNTLYEVNERGFEMATVGGRDYMMTGPQPVQITPNHMLGGGGFTQINNINYRAPYSPTTEAQKNQRLGFETKRALARNGA